DTLRSTLPVGPSQASTGCARDVPSGDLTLSGTFGGAMPAEVAATTRTRRPSPLTRSRLSTRSTMPAFGAGCDTSIQTSPRAAGPSGRSIHGGAGMSLTTIVAAVAHPPSTCAEATVDKGAAGGAPAGAQ